MLARFELTLPLSLQLVVVLAVGGRVKEQDRVGYFPSSGFCYYFPSFDY